MKPDPGVPLRPLVVLAVAVVLLHWLALQAVPEAVTRGKSLVTMPLKLRTVPPPNVAVDPLPQAPRVSPTQSSPSASRAEVPRAAAPSSSSAGRTGQTLPTKTPQPAALLRSEAEPVAGQETAAVEPVLGPALVPGSARWRFDVSTRQSGDTPAGTADLHWRHDGSSYEAVLQWSLAQGPSRTQRSTGGLGPGGLAPSRFSEKLRSEQATHFDRERGRIVFSSNRPDTGLQVGVQDRVSVFLQLAALVAGDPARFTAGTRATLQVAGTREAEAWTFVVEGREELLLRGAPVSALKLTRSPRHEYDLRWELWLGPGPDYGPVRLRLTPPNGDWLDLQWSGTDKG